MLSLIELCSAHSLHDLTSCSKYVLLSIKHHQPACFVMHTGLSTFSVEDPRSATGGKTVLAIGPAPGSSIDEVAGHLKLLA